MKSVAEDSVDSKRTIVLGASPDPSRYSYTAVRNLQQKGHVAVPIGKHNGSIDGTTILLGRPDIENVDTITLYLNAGNQKSMYDYILNLKPKRIIFNPGAENPELAELARSAGIQVENACTLVLLATNVF